MLKAVRLVLLFLGLGAAGFLLWRYGAQIWLQLAQVGWKILPYLGASLLVYVLDALGWRSTWMPGQSHIPFARLFSVRMAGEAVNKVTPLASLGGEPIKVYLLGREGTRTADSLASVTVAKNSITLAQIVFIFAGVALAMGPGLPQNTPRLWTFALFPAIVLALMLTVAILDLRLRRKGAGDSSQQSAVGSQEGAGERERGRRPRATDSPQDWGAGGADPNAQRPTPNAERPPFALARKSRLQAIIGVWSLVADFIWARPRDFALSLFWHFLGWAAGGLEMLAAAYALGISLSPRDALVMESLVIAINMATFLIPANVGTQEGGFVFVAGMMGLTGAQGLALAVLRRCRDAIWICFGLLYLSMTEGSLLLNPRLEYPRRADLAGVSSTAE